LEAGHLIQHVGAEGGCAVISDRARKPFIPRLEYAMTLEDIAAELGTTKKNVSMTIQRALRKLAARPAAFRKLLELSALRQEVIANRPESPQ
jgi:DNA-directed RNA polymerase specialized sigma24 family protein